MEMADFNASACPLPEGITDGSRKCLVLPADAQPQQQKKLTE